MRLSVDVFFHFEYHPLGFPKGVQGMSRTSRCFAEIFLQLGGPGTLSSAERNPYQFPFADFSFSASAHIAPDSLARFFFMMSFGFIDTIGRILFTATLQNKLSTSAALPRSHNLARNLAAQLAAIA